MDPLTQALRGAHQAIAAPAAAAARLDAALVVGGGGALGSALLAQALVAARFRQVAAVVTAPLASALRGFVPMPEAVLVGAGPLAIELAFVVYERARHSNRRDDAFLQPDPADLLPLARSLHARGVRRLVVVVPHSPALLPQALKAGLATLDEVAVAALGFVHLVFVRAAQNAPSAPPEAPALQRFAAWWLSQLRWMVPQREQPVRAVKLAELVVRLAARLRTAPPGTRVLPPELLWQAATEGDAEALFDAWLATGHEGR